LIKYWESRIPNDSQSIISVDVFLILLSIFRNPKHKAL
jgi:hypothetical protein